MKTYLMPLRGFLKGPFKAVNIEPMGTRLKLRLQKHEYPVKF
jgi:hypothetical protein